MIPWRFEVFTSAQNVQGSQKAPLVPQIFNLPLIDLYFTGRKDELKKLYTLCTANHRVAIHGLGGIGKTTLSIKYANEYKNQYKFIYRMSAATPTEIAEGFSKLADKLNISQSNPSERLDLLKELLDHYEKDYLVILDGADSPAAFETLKTYLPERGKCLLLTTRMPEKAKSLNFVPLELLPLEPGDAVNYLIQASGHIKNLQASTKIQEQATLLAEKLGRLPLALSHAAAYIRAQGMSFERYIKLFENCQLELFTAKTLHLEGEESPKTLLTTWQINLNIIEKNYQCRLAKEVIDFFSFLGQSPIPFDLLSNWFAITHPELHALKLRNALSYLKEYSLISSPESDSYSIHVLMQEVSRYWLSSEEARSRALSYAIKGLSSFFKNHNMQDWEKRRIFREWAPHIEAALKHIEDPLLRNCKEKLATENASEILTVVEQLGSIYLWDHRYKEAELMANKALQITKKLYKEDASEVAASYHSLAMAINGLGKHDVALQHDGRVLKIRKDLLEGCVNEIAKDLGEDIDESLEVGQKALEVRKKLLAKYHSIKRPPKESAEVLASKEENLEEIKAKHTFLKNAILQLATSYNNAGLTFSDLKNYEGAREFLEQALDLKKEVLGELHSSVARTYNSLGIVLRHLKMPDQALAYIKKGVEIRESLGERSPGLARSYNNMGYTLLKHGSPEEALIYQRKALDLKEELLIAKENYLLIEIYEVLHNILMKLGEIQENQENYLEAILCKKESLNLREAQNKKDPKLISIHEELAEVWKLLGKQENALHHIKQAQELRAKKERLEQIYQTRRSRDCIIGEVDNFYTSHLINLKRHCILASRQVRLKDEESSSSSEEEELVSDFAGPRFLRSPPYSNSDEE